MKIRLRFLAAAALALAPAASADTGTCGAAFCQCPDGKIVEVACGTGDCIAACGGSSSGYSSGGGGGSSGPSPITIMLQQTSQAMQDAYDRETGAWDAEVAAKKPRAPKWRAQEGCSIAMDSTFAGAEKFKEDAEDLGMKFVLDDYKKAAKALGKKEKSATSYRDAYDELKAWGEQVKTWSADLQEIADCVNSPGCSLVDLHKKINDDVRKWLEESGGKAADAAKRVSEASKLIENYAKQLQASNESNMRLAAHCLAQ
jgi:hypothetical protein